jgi:carbon storage regulator CsrA
MLILTRRLNESVVIQVNKKDIQEDTIHLFVQVTMLRNDACKLGFTGPEVFRIQREENFQYPESK